MKHKHYEMIVAKAENMELVVFIKHSLTNEWENMKLVGSAFPDLGGTHDYFMCLQKHASATLEWLNGGEAQLENPRNQGEFDDLTPFKDRPYWDSSRWFMRDDRESRIKPRKEKRWIAVDTESWATSKAYPTKDDCDNAMFSGCSANAKGWQFIEIEVEV